MFDLASRWVSCVGIVALAACGFEDAAVSSGDPSADGGTSGPEPGTGEGDTDGAGEDDTDVPPGPEIAGCELIDCGPGHCQLENGAPVCVCDEAHASIGYACIPCTGVGATTDLDLPLVVASGRILLNGAPPPKSQYEHGDLYLRNPNTGDEIFMANTRDGTYAVTTVPGTYDVVFVKRNGTNQVPDNQSGLVTRIFIDNLEPIDIEIGTTFVHGSILFGDQKPPASQYEYGRVFLRNAATGDEVPLAETRESDFAANILPGHYTLHYQAVAATAVAPKNPDVIVRAVEIPALGELDYELDASIPVAQVQGSIRLGGATPPNSQYENARILFVDRETGAEIEIAETRHGDYSVHLVHGTYDIVYERIAGTNVMPRNPRKTITGEVGIESSQTLDIDIPVVDLATTVTVGGQPPPASTTDDGVIRLRDPVTGEVVVLGHTRHGSFSTRVVPGTYEIRYGQATAGAVLPANLDARLGEAAIGSDDAVLEVEIPIVEVAGDITIDGTAPPTSEYSDGRVYLKDPETGDSVLLGNTRVGAFEARVVPGRYDIVYVVETTGDGVPLNGAAKVGWVDVIETPAFDVDVPLVRLNGAIFVDGEAPPSDEQNHGVLFLQDLRSADRLSLGDTRNGAYSTRITAGTYLVGYRVTESGGLVPQNVEALFSCIDLGG